MQKLGAYSYNRKWDLRFLELAKLVSTWSKDPSTKVGACAIDPSNRNILAVGYNGFPRNVSDDKRLLDREEKLSLIVHAEMNVIYNAGFNGISLRGSSLYIYGLPPCSDCSRGVIQSGIKHVVIPPLDYWPDVRQKWVDSWEISRKVYEEAGVFVSFVNPVP